MATDREGLLLQIEANLKSYEKELARANKVTVSALRKIERDAEQSVGRLESVFSRAGKTFSSIGRNLAGGIAAGIGFTGIAGLGNMIRSTIADSAKIGELADKLGASTQFIQELQFGASQANISFEELNGWALKFSQNLAQARNGQGELLQLLRANGQEVKATFEENVRLVADLVKNARNPEEALLVLRTAFGKGSDAMAEFFKDGARGLDQLSRDLQKAGGAIDDSMIRKAQDLDKKWNTAMTNMARDTKIFILEAIDLFGKLIAKINEVPFLKSFIQGNNQIGEDILAGNFSDALLGRNNPFNPSPVNRGAKTNREPFVINVGGRPGTGVGNRPTNIPNPEDAAARRKAEADAEAAARRADQAAGRAQKQFNRAMLNSSQRIAALQLEGELLGKSVEEQERARVSLELYNAAREAGITIDDDVRAHIEATAKAYGEAAAKYAELEKQYERSKELNSAVKDSLGGLFQDIRAGVSPVDALTNALGKLADKLIELALNDIFDKLLGADQNGGGGLGAFLASFFHTGGVVGRGGSRRSVNPAVFAGAPRFHSGGLVPGEVPIIAKAGEMVLTPQQFKGLIGQRRGSGGVVVNVRNAPAGSQVQATDKGSDSMGRRQIELWFDDQFARSAQRGGVKNTLFSGFGIRPSVRRT